MRSLAQVLLGRGWRLSGSDLAPGQIHFLIEAGVRVHRGHAAEHLPEGTNLVVFSDAVPADNPERRRAAELGIPSFSYFELLGHLMSRRRGIAVAGTHGKSTAAAMAADLLAGAGLDPTVVYGASPLGSPCGGRAGQGELMLVEACEYRANFLHLCPQQAVILGIEPDHFDYYRSARQLERAFAAFAARVPKEGLVLAAADCPVTRRVTSGLGCRVETFGLRPDADWSACGLQGREGRYRLSIVHRGEHLGDVRLRIPGRHNVINALAAAAVASANGVREKQVCRGLSEFRGLCRRLQTVGDWGGVVFVDDYAHHPTEVAAGLRAVREMYPGRRLWCVFQPHQASRTEVLLDELAESLQNADRVVVAEIFRAREGDYRPGEPTAAELGREVARGGVEVPQVHTAQEIVRLLETRLEPGDVVVMMGAGDIGKVRDGLVERIREDRAAG